MVHTASIIKPSAISAYIAKQEKDEWKFLLLRRSSKHLNGTWQMVTGGIGEGEKAWQAALREIFEETGLKPKSLFAVDSVEIFYEIRFDHIMVCPCFIAFVDNNQDVILSANEHDAYEWISYEQAILRVAFAEQRRLIQHIYDNFLLKTPNKILEIALS